MESEMLDVMGVVLGIPAAAFFILAVAFGLNPVRAAAWGAICGVVGFASFMSRWGAWMLG